MAQIHKVYCAYSDKCQYSDNGGQIDLRRGRYKRQPTDTCHPTDMLAETGLPKNYSQTLNPWPAILITLY